MSNTNLPIDNQPDPFNTSNQTPVNPIQDPNQTPIQNPNQTPIAQPQEEPDGPKNGSSLTRIESFASYTEPGPIDSDLVRSPTTDEFMAILERNSAVLQQASEKNQEIAAKSDIAKKDDSNEQSKAADEVKFTDIVDAGKETTDTTDNANDKEQSKAIQKVNVQGTLC